MVTVQRLNSEELEARILSLKSHFIRGLNRINFTSPEFAFVLKLTIHKLFYYSYNNGKYKWYLTGDNTKVDPGRIGNVEKYIYIAAYSLILHYADKIPCSDYQLDKFEQSTIYNTPLLEFL